MNHRIAYLLFAILLAEAAASVPALNRYQVILDRKPFGAELLPQADASAGAPPVAPAEIAVNNLKMSAIVEADSSHLTVGIMDVKNNKSYMLAVGESEDGLEVVKALYAEEKALVRKDDIERWISMAGNDAPVGAPGVAAAPAPAAMAAPPPQIPAPKYTARLVAAAGPGLTKEEYAKTRASRPTPMSHVRRRMLAENPVFAKATPEQLDAYLQEYNMELIRAGGELGPALPIELTPEQDSQLVQEGVLPPP
jgi:hypothetical protein